MQQKTKRKTGNEGAIFQSDWVRKPLTRAVSMALFVGVVGGAVLAPAPAEAAVEPNFVEVTGIANPMDGLDAGSYGSATFADIDGDGDLDAFSGEGFGTVRFYRNDGYYNASNFVEVTGAGNPFSSLASPDLGTSSKPVAADFDADGDVDFIVGLADGTLKAIENIGSKTNPVLVEKTGTNNPFVGVNVGLSAAPAIVDLDGDGDLDLPVGSNDGTIHYLENVGTNVDPNWVEQTGSANPFDGLNLGSGTRVSPAFADIDGDGDFDAAAGRSVGDLAIYFKNTGSKTAPAFTKQGGTANPFDGIDTGTSSSAPSFGDIDGDGDVDLILSHFQGTFQYFRNDSIPVPADLYVTDAADNPASGIDVGTNAVPFVSGFYAQGPDELVVGAGNGTVRTFLGTGSKTNTSWVEKTGTNNPFSGVDVGDNAAPTFVDLDGDGDLDGVVGGADGLVRYFENTGDALAPALLEQTGSANPFNGLVVGGSAVIAWADVDHDGDLDGVVGSNLGTLDYFENTGTAISPAFVKRTGSSNPFDSFDVGTNSKPAFGDIDGDGDLELLVGAADGSVHLFTPLVHLPPANPVYVEKTGSNNPFHGIDVGANAAPAFTDIDGDGDIDALVGNDSGSIMLFKNAEAPKVPNDFNGDGMSDILWRNSTTGGTSMWFVDGLTIAGTAPLGTVPTNWIVAATGDFNGDRTSDIVWRNQTTGNTNIWFMDNGSVIDNGNLGVIGTAFSLAGSGDFNGDGNSDLLWRNNATGGTSIWFVDGLSITGTASLGIVPTFWIVSGTGDFDRDGSSDIVWRNQSTGRANIWFMDNGTVKDNGNLGVISTAFDIAGTGDFNGDGKSDLLWRNGSTGGTSMWFVDGLSITGTAPLGTVPTNWIVATTGDYNGTTTSDIVWRNQTTGRANIWFLNDGAVVDNGNLGVIGTNFSIVP